MFEVKPIGGFTVLTLHTSASQHIAPQERIQNRELQSR